MAKATLTEQVAALRRKVAKLEARIEAVEQERRQELTACIGFEVDQPDDFDYDEPEYQLQIRPARGMGAAGRPRKLRRRD